MLNIEIGLLAFFWGKSCLDMCDVLDHQCKNRRDAGTFSRTKNDQSQRKSLFS